MNAHAVNPSPDLDRTDVVADAFLAVLVTNDRTGVLAELTAEAVRHFGHQQLRVRQVTVVASDGGDTLLATARFSDLATQV